MKKIIFSLYIILFLSYAGVVSASTLNLSPSGGSVGVGSTLAVSVKLNTGGEAVNAVSAFLSYPSDKLDVVSVTAGGAFSIEAEKSFGEGFIKISRGNINPVSGNITIATVTFRGKALGTAAVAIAAGSAVPRASDSSDSLNLSASTGGTYNVVKAQPKQTAAPLVTQTSEPVQPPVISGIKVTDITTRSAIISWITNTPLDSNIEYGLEKGNYFLSASDGNLVTEHKITLEGPLLTAGAKFHFRVFSRDNSNNLSVSEDMEFELIGYKVILKVVNKRGNPVQKADVEIDPEGEKGITDENGETRFENVTLGKHPVVIKSSFIEKSGEIEVIKTSDIQNFELNFDLLPYKDESSKVLFDRIVAGVLITGILGLLLLGIFLFMRGKGKKGKGNPKNFPDLSGPAASPGEPVVFRF